MRKDGSHCGSRVHWDPNSKLIFHSTFLPKFNGKFLEIKSFCLLYILVLLK